jgi:hypothetical protein
LAVGFSPAERDRFCASGTLAGRIDNHLQVNNQEQGAPVWFCQRLRGSWRDLWPQLKVIG